MRLFGFDGNVALATYPVRDDISSGGDRVRKDGLVVRLEEHWIGWGVKDGAPESETELRASLLEPFVDVAKLRDPAGCIAEKIACKQS